MKDEPVKIAIAGIAVECCTFSPLLTEEKDFTVLSSDALLARHPFIDTTVAEVVPILRARALPGGPIAKDFYEQLEAEILNILADQGPWDGVYLDLHGAMFVEGRLDAEAGFIRNVRELVGNSCLIAASYDLHGNVSQAIIDHLDILTAYRTAPHEDEQETCQRAWKLLLRCLHEGIKPIMRFVSLPLLLSGEQMMTTEEPAKSLYASLEPLIKNKGLLDASILTGYCWADEPRTGVSTVVLGNDKEIVEQTVLELAGLVWTQRHKFGFGQRTAEVDECIDIALSSTEKPIFISDAGDNVTGGGVGDVPFVLERLVAKGPINALFASLVDAEVVKKCFLAGADAHLRVSLGAKLDTKHGKPLTLTIRIVRLYNDFTNPCALIETHGIHVILTSQRTAFTEIRQFENLGLDISHYKIVVVKLGYLFPQLRNIAALSLLAFSPGVINPKLSELSYISLGRPVFPLDPAVTWI